VIALVLHHLRFLAVLNIGSGTRNQLPLAGAIIDPPIKSDDYYVTGIEPINALESGPAGAHYGTKRVARIIKGDVCSRFYEPALALCRFRDVILVSFFFIYQFIDSGIRV